MTDLKYVDFGEALAEINIIVGTWVLLVTPGKGLRRINPLKPAKRQIEN